MISAVKPAETSTDVANGAAPVVLPKPIRQPLLGVTKGRITAPYRALVYGPEGVGKTTFAATSENVIFLCKESGTEQYDIARLPQPTQWRDAYPDDNGIKCDVVSLTDMLRFSDHNYKTLAVDTLDWIEPLIFKHVCDSDPKSKGNIVLAYGGYGKGFDIAINEWRSWLSQLDALRHERGMNIILLAHSHIKNFNNPEGENFDRYQLKMNDKASGVLKEWCDAVLFAHQVIFAAGKETNDKKKFGVSDQTRYLFTNRRPAWDAKNRFGLPEQMPLMWSEFIKHVRTKSPENIDMMINQAQEMASLLKDPDKTEALAAIARTNRDPDRLAQLINYIQSQSV